MEEGMAGLAMLYKISTHRPKFPFQQVLQDQRNAVLYTPTAFPMDSYGLSSDPAISDGFSRQSIGLPLESIGIHQK